MDLKDLLLVHQLKVEVRLQIPCFLQCLKIEKVMSGTQIKYRVAFSCRLVGQFSRQRELLRTELQRGAARLSGLKFKMHASEET